MGRKPGLVQVVVEKHSIGLNALPVLNVDGVVVVNMQEEFLFCQPFLYQKALVEQSWRNMFNQIASLYPNYSGVNLDDLFQDCDSKIDGLSFPITMICGRKDQYEFFFSRCLDQDFWGDLTVQYTTDEGVYV